MTRNSATWQHYGVTPAGVLIPSGSTADFQSFSATNVFATKIEGHQLLNLVRSHGLDPARSPSLIKLVEDTTAVSTAILCGRNEAASQLQIFSALQLRRVIEAVHAVGDHPALPRILSELLDGTLDLLERAQSKAKDTLWELELLGTLQANGVEVTLGEPDLVVSSAPVPMGIACKKIYSEANFRKRIQSAVRQIEREFDSGIVAFNLDDLVPERQILQAKSMEFASNTLSDLISRFMHRHERTLRRYIEPGRAVAVLVSCAALSDITKSEPRFCNYRQTVGWHIPEVSESLDDQFQHLLEAFHARVVT